MPDKDKHASAVAPASPDLIRNVVLIGPSGAGKTTLVEQLLVATGTIGRAGRVEEGTTVSDFDEAEHKQHRSIALALAPVVSDGIKINLIDTPGYADFVGDLRAGLRAADAALFVLSAVDGLDAATAMLWEECAAVEMPRAVIVTKLDKERADFDETVSVCQRVFGDGVLPLYLPMHADDGSAAGVIGLLTGRIYDYSSGVRESKVPDPEHVSLIQSARNALVEAIIAESEDETLMDRYLAGDELDTGTLIDDLETAIARGSFFPVLPMAHTPVGFGTAELLEAIVRAFPSPLERTLPIARTPEGKPVAPLSCDAEGPLCAEIVKTTSDSYVGRVSLVRVFSGTIRPDIPVHVSGHPAPGDHVHIEHDVDERVGALSSPLGKALRTVPMAIAGDIVAVAKLAHAETGDTLSDKGFPLLVEPWVMPHALLPVAIVAHSKADEDKLAGALSRLVAEDPTLRLERNVDTHQVVLWCMGEAHVEVLLDRLQHRFGVSVDSVPLRVSLRETFATSGHGHGRIAKQSGGHGQFAVCDIEVEPLAPGTGFEFVDKTIGGAIARQYVTSIEKGIRTQMEHGVAAGYPVVDIRVSLIDGKSHSVDSSDMAFANAGGLALRDAATNASVTLLEPVDDVAVHVSDEYVGSVMTDLSGRRGRVAGTEPLGAGQTLVRAEVPQLELTRYAVELRSLSHGTASFTREYRGHEQMPTQLAKKIQADGAGR